MEDLESKVNKEKRFFSKKNLKCVLADLPSAFFGYGIATATTIVCRENDIPDEYNVLMTVFAKSVGFYVGNLISYPLMHLKEYKEEEKSLKEDIKKLNRSNIVGLSLTLPLKALGHYALLKLTNIPYEIIPSIVYPAAGAVGTFGRYYSNFRQGLFNIPFLRKYQGSKNPSTIP